MWGLPMFDLPRRRRHHEGTRRLPTRLWRSVYPHFGFDSTHGWEFVRISFIVNRPQDEPGFRLSRQESVGRNMRYSTHAYARGAT